MVTWIITTRERRLSGWVPYYPFRAIRAHLLSEKEVFVFGYNDGVPFELMYYAR
jgi:hypothetical protein